NSHYMLGFRRCQTLFWREIISNSDCSQVERPVYGCIQSLVRSFPVLRGSPPMAHKLATASLYSPHPSIEYARSVLANFERKTGRNVEEWVALVKKAGPKSEEERRTWLKNVYGVGTNIAWWIAERAEGRGQEDFDEESYLKAAPGYVEAMYAGGKAGLRPLHDHLLELGRSL